MRDEGPKSRFRLAVDIGGTFTDIAAFDEREGRIALGKALSTPHALVEGIAAGVAKANLDLAEVSIFLHGSTIAINTLLERTGAKTALLVTEGFADIYEIGRVNRPDAFNLFFAKHRPLVERALRFEVHERLMADGSVLKPLDEAEIRTLAVRLRALGIEAVGILLLHSYRNPAHEIRVRDILREEMPEAFISASHELSREYREFERVSTVAANAYIGPKVARYVDEIEQHLQQSGFRGSFFVVQSTGGLFEAGEARRHCVRMLESGPAAGVIGARAVSRELGLPDIIAFDMGGTTAKAGVIHQGEALTTGSALIGGYERALPVQIAMMDIFEVGTGGGSIARLSHGKTLRVGPDSAGSAPGPACYGMGGAEPTVTDANLVLGRLDPDHFLGGEMKLDPDAAASAIRDMIAAPLGLSLEEAADGILRIAATSMSYAVKAVTTERGLDAGAFGLLVYGGAGPLHASLIAREIGIKQIIVPPSPGHFSATGMLFSDLRHDFVRTGLTRLSEANFEALEHEYRAMAADGVKAIEQTAARPAETVVRRAADIRYVGQEHAVTLDIPEALFHARDRAGIKQRFDKLHELRYGTCAPKEPAEIVSVRTTVIGVLAKPRFESIVEGATAPEREARRGRRRVFFREAKGFVDAAVFSRPRLKAGNRIEGPALIEEHASTTIALPGDRLVVDRLGNLLIAVGALQR
ncbi:MAG TPA: hydantoinase/oxoprolinase family protein [Stellaceae bacterium]|nr:hydantoinase/oxoprolinase family protein [Stellaceae bacterium]